MFDIGFTELMVIGVVALIVLGPERLPKAARTAGHLLGRFQRYVSNVKADINREMEMEELRKLRAQVQDAAETVEQSIREGANEAQGYKQAVETETQHLMKAIDDEPAPRPSTPVEAEKTTSSPDARPASQPSEPASDPVPNEPPRGQSGQA